MSRSRLCAMASVVGLVVLMIFGNLWTVLGNYRMHVLLRHGGTWWIDVPPGSTQFLPSMCLAISTAPIATPGPIAWTRVADGFEIADLPALVDGQAVDHVLLARIDPVHFRFEVRTAPAGDNTRTHGA